MAIQNLLTTVLTDLYFPSESEEPIEYITVPIDTDLPLTAEQFKVALEIADEKIIEPLDVEKFWERVTTVKEWFGEDELATVKKFDDLKNTLFDNLTNIQGYRVGEVEIDIYLFGKNDENEIEGIKTMSVET